MEIRICPRNDGNFVPEMVNSRCPNPLRVGPLVTISSFLRVSIAILVLATSACSSFAGRLADDLNDAIQAQNDLSTVRDGAPAYLLMIDGLIEGDPKNVGLLLTGARLYGAYATAFVEDPERNRRLSERALDYARRALCIKEKKLCAATSGSYEEFVAELDQVNKRSLEVLYVYVSAWAGWLQAHSDDWEAIAELPKIRAGMLKVIALQDDYENGAPHVYMGVIETLLPPALGGKPEVARGHFETAIEQSQGKNLMVKVLFARHYARLVFDRELHDELLYSVVDSKRDEPGYTLVNTLARSQASELLATADEYF